MPAFKASGDITSMSQADGYIEIPTHTDIVEAGEIVDVKLFCTVMAHASSLTSAPPFELPTQKGDTRSLAVLPRERTGAARVPSRHLVTELQPPVR